MDHQQRQRQHLATEPGLAVVTGLTCLEYCRGSMNDLEEQVGRVWNPDVRPLVAEAFRCYSTGAARACIALTWIAVCADLIEKINRLAEDGEAQATALANKIEGARGRTDPPAIQIMQDIEKTVLDAATELDLLDAVEKRELARLREDRNLCAHPSLRPLGELYEPSLEYARAHLAVALSALLTHPPSQGRKAMERFRAHIIDPSFSGSSEYLIHVFFDNVKASTRRQIVQVAVKHAVLELDAPDPPGAVIVANRMATCVLIFAKRDRDLVKEAMKKTAERLHEVDGGVQLRTAGRLGDLDVFWAALDDATRSQLDMVITNIPTPVPWPDQLDENTAAVLALVSVDNIRSRISALKAKFELLSSRDRATVISRRPSQYFAEWIPGLLRDASSFRGAEYMTSAAVIPCGRHLSMVQLSEILHNWAENDQCRQASGMLQLSLELYAATAHLRPGNEEIWRQFIAEVREYEGPDSFYRYEKLEVVLNS